MKDKPNKILAIDVGGTEIKYGLLDDSLVISGRGHIPTPQTDFDAFKAAVRQIYEPHRDDVGGIALSMPGFVDVRHGKILGGGALTYNWDKEIIRELQTVCSCRISMENDGKCAAIAEHRSGALKGTQNSAVFIIGTGVGGGIITDGKLLRGKDSTAGEYSFLIMYHKDFDKQEKELMAHRCATPALLEWYKEYSGSSEEIDGRIFFDRYQRGDNAAAMALDRFTEGIATQIFNLGVLLNLEKVAIGGGISRQNVLIEKIREQLGRLWVNRFDNLSYFNPFLPEVCACHYGPEANLIGAYYSFLDHEKEDES